jgi:hypothetical protein
MSVDYTMQLSVGRTVGLRAVREPCVEPCRAPCTLLPSPGHWRVVDSFSGTVGWACCLGCWKAATIMLMRDSRHLSDRATGGGRTAPSLCLIGDVCDFV